MCPEGESCQCQQPFIVGPTGLDFDGCLSHCEAHFHFSLCLPLLEAHSPSAVVAMTQHRWLGQSTLPSPMQPPTNMCACLFQGPTKIFAWRFRGNRGAVAETRLVHQDSTSTGTLVHGIVRTKQASYTGSGQILRHRSANAADQLMISVLKMAEDFWKSQCTR